MQLGSDNLNIFLILLFWGLLHSILCDIINVFKPRKPVPNQDSAYKPILHSLSCL